MLVDPNFDAMELDDTIDDDLDGELDWLRSNHEVLDCGRELCETHQNAMKCLCFDASSSRITKCSFSEFALFPPCRYEARRLVVAIALSTAVRWHRGVRDSQLSLRVLNRIRARYTSICCVLPALLSFQSA